MKTINKIAFVLSTLLLCTACDSFLNHDVPQATLSEEQVNDPLYIDNICISVVLRDTTFVCVVGADIEIPHRERRVDIFCGDEDSISGDTDIVDI